jgi:hypothetical protein
MFCIFVPKSFKKYKIFQKVQKNSNMFQVCLFSTAAVWKESSIQVDPETIPGRRSLSIRCRIINITLKESFILFKNVLHFVQKCSAICFKKFKKFKIIPKCLKMFLMVSFVI